MALKHSYVVLSVEISTQLLLYFSNEVEKNEKKVPSTIKPQAKMSPSVFHLAGNHLAIPPGVYYTQKEHIARVVALKNMQRNFLPGKDY